MPGPIRYKGCVAFRKLAVIKNQNELASIGSQSLNGMRRSGGKNHKSFLPTSLTKLLPSLSMAVRGPLRHNSFPGRAMKKALRMYGLINGSMFTIRLATTSARVVFATAPIQS